MIKKYYNILFLFLLTAALGCSKGSFDINTDPNSPSTLPEKNLLTYIERLIASENTSGGTSGSLEVLVHRITQREEPNAYIITNGGGVPNGLWDNYYTGVITNANLIIEKATTGTANNFRYAGIAKIIKAYAFSQLVDVFGDVPFTDANQLLSETAIRYPKFDKGADIYPKLFTMIDEGLADLQNTTKNTSNPGSDDVIYNGSVTKWVRFGNTLKLKLYNQVRKVQNVASEVNALLGTPDLLMKSADDNFQVNYTSDFKNPGIDQYAAAQRTRTISPWFYEILRGTNTNIFNGIEDPRIPYYFYNQLGADQEGTNDNNDTEYRDGPFVSIYFASSGNDVGRTQQKTATMEGIYPVGGKYDNGQGVAAVATDGVGAAPGRMLTYADRLFIEAELKQAAVATTASTAADLLNKAITEAFKQVDFAVKNQGATAPALNGSANATQYLTSIGNYFNSSADTKKMEIILTQKWISSFGSAIDAYADFRRTGFPKMFDPSTLPVGAGGQRFAQPPVDGNPQVSPQKPVPITLIRPFPNSLIWPQGELSANKNAPSQKTDMGAAKVFWQQ